MTTMIRRLLGTGLIAIVPLAVAAAGRPPKPPKLAETPAMTTFRCTAGDSGSSSCGAVSDATDRVRDDGQPYGYDLTRILSSGFYQFNFPSGSGRVLNLALGAPIAPPACSTAGNCNPDHSQVVGYPKVGSDALDLQTASIAVKPLVTSDGAELAGLLWGMSCNGSPYQAKVHYTFSLPSGNGHWGFNFNKGVYPETDNATITRASDGLHWTVETNGLKGELLSWNHTGLRRPQSGPSHEGFYYVNFKFTIEIASLPSPSVGC